MNETAIVEHDLTCRMCGYNLRGLAEARCPECGSEFNPKEVIISAVPWLHRRRIGRWRAYWKTAWMVITRPGDFRDELFRRGGRDESEAQQFRQLSITIATVTGIVTALVIQFEVDSPRNVIDAVINFISMTMIAGVPLIVLLTFATAIHFRAPDGFSSSLYLYSAAPLAVSPLTGTFIVIGVSTENDAAFAVAGILAAVIFGLMIRLMTLAYGAHERVSFETKAIFILFTLPTIWLTAVVVMAITAVACIATAAACIFYPFSIFAD